MNKIKKKHIGKKELIRLTRLKLLVYSYTCAQYKIIDPVIKAFIASINLCLENNLEISIRGFGTFSIRPIKNSQCKFGDKEFTTNKKRRIHFKYLNKNFK